VVFNTTPSCSTRFCNCPIAPRRDGLQLRPELLRFSSFVSGVVRAPVPRS
jgi:hypothetical protein